MDNKPRQRLEILSESLGLVFEEQDWGIINADGRRLNEFIDLYVNASLPETTRYQMFELILASANDALEQGIEPDITANTLVAFIDVHECDFPEQVKYWSELSDEVEFPIVKHLEKFR